MAELQTTVILIALACYGVATLVSDYDGPANLFVKIRKLHKVFRCNTCLSFWFVMISSIFIFNGSVLYMLATLGLTVAMTRKL